MLTGFSPEQSVAQPDCTGRVQAFELGVGDTVETTPLDRLQGQRLGLDVGRLPVGLIFSCRRSVQCGVERCSTEVARISHPGPECAHSHRCCRPELEPKAPLLLDGVSASPSSTD